MSASYADQRESDADFQRTAEMVNVFIISTTQLLNRFVAECDRKLYENHKHLERLAVQTALLEHKLQRAVEDEEEQQQREKTTAQEGAGARVSSIAGPPVPIVPPPMPGLQAAAGPTVGAPRREPPLPPGYERQAANVLRGGVQPVRQLLPPPMLPFLQEHVMAPSERVPPPPPLLPASGGYVMCNHPLLKGYYELLSLHVPAVSVREKMRHDGFPPEWLNTPNELAPTNLSATIKEFSLMDE